MPPPLHILLPAQFRNDIYGFTTGVEIAPEWRPANFWRLRAIVLVPEYESGKMRRERARGDAGERGQDRARRHEVTMDSSFDITKKLQAGFDLSLRQRLVGRERTRLFHRRRAYRLALYPQLEFSVVGQNLFQPYHVEYAADPGGPVAILRNVYASLAWRTK